MSNCNSNTESCPDDPLSVEKITKAISFEDKKYYSFSRPITFQEKILITRTQNAIGRFYGLKSVSSQKWPRIVILNRKKGKYGGRFVVIDGKPRIGVLDNRKDVVALSLVHELTHAGLYLTGEDLRGDHTTKFYKLLKYVYNEVGVRKDLALELEDHGVPKEWLDDLYNW